MRKFFKLIFIVMMIVASLSLTACLRHKEEAPQLSLADCISKSGYKASNKGENILYYYATPTEVSLYYCNNWKSGRIECKRYFLDKETYELEKSLAKADRYKDEELWFSIKNYKVVDNMDTYWDEIETSSVYTIVK